MRRYLRLFLQSTIGGTVLGILAAGCVLFLWGFLGLFPTPVPEFDSRDPHNSIRMMPLPIPYAHLRFLGDVTACHPSHQGCFSPTVKPAAAGESQGERSERRSPL